LKGKWKGRKEEEDDVSGYWMSLGKEKILELEKGSTRSPSMGNSL
jgi:hypothetical protein